MPNEGNQEWGIRVYVLKSDEASEFYGMKTAFNFKDVGSMANSFKM